MLKSRNEFIARHLSRIKTDNLQSDSEKFKQLLKSVLSQEEFKQASSYFDKTQSITQTLSQFDLSTLNDELLTKLIAVEKKHQIIIAMDQMAKFSVIKEQVFSLMTMRLQAGLSYALVLTAIASFIFYMMSYKVLTQFQQVFDSFGAELPALTAMAITWSHSYFPPYLLVFILLAFIGFILYQSKKFKINKPNRFFKQLPFLSNVFQYIKVFSYLSEINLLAKSGLSLKQIKSAEFIIPNELNQFLPDAEKEIEIADNLEQLSTELNYQLDTLSLKAENTVISATRNLIGVVMGLVIFFVSFVLIASYLPIFQLGSGL